ncbi:hypothetical protein B0H34DRAFT_406483 [Crassisporium funariophilum]|nr:hypothetical protein B0H34DRAFT_406483 [Crassisporium funariophilum]
MHLCYVRAGAGSLVVARIKPIIHFFEATESGIIMSSQGSVPISDNGTSVWPRRASKVREQHSLPRARLISFTGLCELQVRSRNRQLYLSWRIHIDCNTRRDKIRCDGARPCSGCAKKGYSAEQCKDGCEPCRRARVRCEDGKPCQRCREMQIDCIDEIVSAILRSSSPPLPPRSSRGGHERAKLACLSCRRDNKKCDDQRPCSRCIARSEDCVHIGRGPKLVKLRCEGCREDNKRCEDSRPCKHCVESSKPCVLVPRKGRGVGSRVKTACMSCRRDKIRCDGVRPCASCIRKRCECIERACKTCSRSGKAAECTHRKPQDSGLSDNGDSTVQDDASEHGSSSFLSASPTAGVSQAPRQHYYTQAAPASPPQPYSMYPPQMHQQQHQHQYFFGPQHGQPNHALPPLQNSVFSTDSRSSYYHDVIDPNIDRYPHEMASNTRTLLPDN